MITYQIEKDITITEFKALLEKSTLAERRPINEPERLAKMLEHGNLIVTARDHGQLVGIARSITDFVYCTYLSDLAVDVAYQKQGIGNFLLISVETKFKELNINEYELDVESINHNAIAFYYKQGFIVHNKYRLGGQTKLLLKKTIYGK